MEAIGRADSLKDPRFSNFVTRIQNARDGIAMIAPWVAEHTVAEVVSALAEKNIPCAEVAAFEAVNSSEQLAARGMLAQAPDETFGTVAVPGDPISMSEAPNEIRSSCPKLGRHTEEVLREWLGAGDDEISALRKARAIN
ncbi:MAG: CoA transferase [bacterium]